MELTLVNFEKGIYWWRTQKMGKWPQDFHNSVYYDLYKMREYGLTCEWWKRTVNRLWDWRAIRSKRPPNKKREIWERGLVVLPKLQEYYSEIRKKSVDEPTFLDLQWYEIENFYNKLAEIKGSPSPNFPSKLGHFIFPKLFIVMDHQATGIKNYSTFWSSMRWAWERFQEKEKAKKVLVSTISKYSDKPLHKRYPLEIKIIELCNIGSKHG